MKVNKLLQLLRDNAQPRAEGLPTIRVDLTDADAHIYVYDVIDSWFGASAASLVEALGAAGQRQVHLHINSPGGDVFEARAMAAAIVAYPGKVISHIDGLAASASTYLALAANEVRMTEGGLFMVHNSWTLAMGDKNELIDTAALLEKVDQSIAADYARKTGTTAADVHAWMDAETWFSAAEALAAKFIDAIDPNTKAAGQPGAANKTSAKAWDLSAYANAPKPAESSEDDITARSAAQLQANRNRLRLIAAI